MSAYERLLNYVVVHTASDEFSETTPTTQRQFDLANMLVPEMKALGIEDARVSDLCCVYGTLPATLGYEDAPAIGLLAHTRCCIGARFDNPIEHILWNHIRFVFSDTSSCLHIIDNFAHLIEPP